MLVCTTAEFGYSIGDEAIFQESDVDGSASKIMSVWADATNVGIAVKVGGLTLVDRPTGITRVLTNASWRFVLRAWL